MSARPRVAVAGFMHETNTFSPAITEFSAFEKPGGSPHIMYGSDILEKLADRNWSTPGAVDVFNSAGATPVPLLWCHAEPAGKVSRRAFEHACDLLTDALIHAGNVDAIQLELHGAMVAEHINNPEVELIERLRHFVGDDVPIAVTLDLHANTSTAMIEAVDYMDAYRTYPHVDMRATGQRAARALIHLLETGTRYAKAERRLEFMIPSPWQCTTIEPAQSIYKRLIELSSSPACHLAFTPGFNAADVPWAGPVLFGYGGSVKTLESAIEEIHALLRDAEPLFYGRVRNARDAVQLALEHGNAAGPVIIADAEDNPGSGGAGDTTTLLAELIEHGATEAVVGLLCDPDVVAAAVAAGSGSTIRCALGGKSDGNLYEGVFVVDAIASGPMEPSGAILRGGSLDIGMFVVLRIGGVRVVVTCTPIQIMDRCVFKRVNIDVSTLRILVLKSIVHFRNDFEAIASEIIVAAASGRMPVDPRNLPFRNLDPQMRLAPGVRQQ